MMQSMWNNGFGTWHMGYFGGQFGLPFGGVLLILAWSLVWKGLALWHAVKRNEEGWFIAILLINTAGILEILYLATVVKLWSNSRKVTSKR